MGVLKSGQFRETILLPFRFLVFYTARVICNVLSVRQPCPLLTRKRPNRRITAIHVDCVVEIGSADKIRRPELVIINSDLRSFAPIAWN